MHIHIHIYIYIYIYIIICGVRERAPLRMARRLASLSSLGQSSTAMPDLPTNIVDFGRFDSSIMLI